MPDICLRTDDVTSIVDECCFHLVNKLCPTHWSPVEDRALLRHEGVDREFARNAGPDLTESETIRDGNAYSLALSPYSQEFRVVHTTLQTVV